MRGGKPVLPTSPEELLQQARQFQQRTGKAYLIQSNVGDTAYAARNLYTYMMAQGAVLFPDPKQIRLQHARRPPRRRVFQAHQRRAARHAEHGHAGGDRRVHERGRAASTRPAPG